MGSIYKITNKLNGKSYIGQTMQLVVKRWRAHISRKSTSAIHAAIKAYGKENFSFEVIEIAPTIEELNMLADDVFQYFGLGCRNVSKIFIPKAYNFSKLFKAFEGSKNVIDNHKYFNNYEYNKAVYLINNIPHLDNGFFLLKEDLSLHSPIATLYYEYFEDIESLKTLLSKRKNQIQCIISNYYSVFGSISFGKSQMPELNDYADGVDVIEFASSI